MEEIRKLLRSSLSESLRAMKEHDRLAAAWPVVCGKAMAERGEIIGYSSGEVTIEVADGPWIQQMRGMEKQLVGELGRIAGVQVSGIHFVVKGNVAR